MASNGWDRVSKINFGAYEGAEAYVDVDKLRKEQRDVLAGLAAFDGAEAVYDADILLRWISRRQTMSARTV